MATILHLVRITRLVATSSMIYLTMCIAASGADLVTVHLQSGRSFTAHVDARTDQHRLWLRFGDSSTILLRPIHWKRVVSAHQDGKELSVEQLQELAESINSAPVLENTNESFPSTVDLETSEAAALERESYAQRAQEALGFSPRITSIAFDAHLANWDADVETDGLIVRLYPMAAGGHITHVGGSLEIELTAVRGAHSNEALNGRRTVVVARWTKQIRPEDIGPSGAVIKLPFAAQHPEFDTNFSTHGLVHVRLAAPGHGVFEQSQDGVRIRPFAPLRDELQRVSGHRFLPEERTGRGKR